MNMSCSRCGTIFDDAKAQCPSCRKWHVKATADIYDDGADDGTMTLDNVRSSEVDRIHVGEYDYCFGGGVVKTSVTIIGGTPGAGKSTMLLTLANRFAVETQKETLYIGAEQAVDEIKMLADRLKLSHAKLIRVLPAMSGVSDLPGILQRRKPGAIILDSLQGLVGEDDASSVYMCKLLKQYAVQLLAPAIIICHVTKSNDIAGLMTLQHAVDSLMTLFPDQDSGLRSLQVLKNRFGPAYINTFFDMTAAGLVYVPEDRIEDAPAGKPPENDEDDEDDD